MRYLKPTGKIEIEGKIYDIIFSLDVIDEVQSRTEMSIIEVIRLLLSKKHKKAALSVLLKYLTGQEILINDDTLDYYSQALINIFIDQIKYKDMPKPKKDDDTEEIPFIDVEYWFYVGKVVLGFRTDEVWRMTIGQIRTLLQEYYKFHGLIKDDKIYNVDDVIPY